MDATSDLLDFGRIDVYHITWNKNNTTYYLLDMTDDLQHIMWTTNRHDALYFYTEKEATKHSKAIRITRPGVQVVAGEIDIIEELKTEGF